MVAKKKIESLQDIKAATAAEEPKATRKAVKDKRGRSYATGKRKDAVARVWIMPGKGNITINDKSIDEYFAREVLPYAPDAWIDRSKTKIGYEIPMTRYFYEYQAPEPVEDIMARITQLEQDISASLAALFHKEA